MMMMMMRFYDDDDDDDDDDLFESSFPKEEASSSGATKTLIDRILSSFAIDALKARQLAMFFLNDFCHGSAMRCRQHRRPGRRTKNNSFSK